MHGEERLARWIRKAFCAIFCPCDERPRRWSRDATFAIKTASGSVITFKSEGARMTTLTVKDSDVPGKVDYTVGNFKDSKGKPAKIDGLPVITADNADVVDSVSEVKDNGDGTYTATLHITDNLGAANVTTTADGDPSSDVATFSFVDVVSVIPGNAVSGEGTFGAVTPDPAP